MGAKKRALRQTQDRKSRADQSAYDERERLRIEAREAENAARKLTSQVKGLERDLRTAQKSATHAILMQQQMHESLNLLKAVIGQLRALHVPQDSKGRLDARCVECALPWPCETLKAIRDPEDQAVYRLLKLERALSSDDPDPVDNRDSEP